MIRYCSVCCCKRWFTDAGDCVVCIGLFNDAYPICMFAPENDSPLSYAARVAPLPDRRKS